MWHSECQQRLETVTQTQRLFLRLEKPPEDEHGMPAPLVSVVQWHSDELLLQAGWWQRQAQLLELGRGEIKELPEGFCHDVRRLVAQSTAVVSR